MYVDGLQVSVYELTRGGHGGGEVRELKKEVDTVVSQLLDTLPAARVTRAALRKTRVNGVPGFKVGYTYTGGGHVEVTAVSYFLFSGEYECDSRGRRVADELGQAAATLLQAAMPSFTVGERRVSPS